MIDSLLRIDVVLFLVIGLLGGAHCIGMCGPLVTTYAKRMGARTDGGGTGATGGTATGGTATGGTATRASRDGATGATGATDRFAGHLTPYEVRQHLLFNVGRTGSYAVLGALFGTLGGVVFLTTDQLTAGADLVRGLTGVGIGAVIVVLGVKYVLGGVAGGIRLPGLGRVTGWLTQHVDRFVNGPGILGLGAIHGLLPCPILYPAYLFAFASGSTLTGGISMLALGLGTIPAVFGYGTLIESVDAVHRRRVHRALGIAFVVLGYVLFAHGLMSLGIHVPHPGLPHYQPL